MDGIEAVYGSSRGALRNLTNRPRRPPGAGGMTLDPFVWEEDQRRGGGAWVDRFPVDGEGGIQEIGRSPSPRPASPSGVQSLMLNAKDKEALLEESIRLKRAIHWQGFFLRRDKVHASTVEIENRKLGFDIKDMETQGALETVKSPPGRSIRTRLKGLKIRYDNMRAVCDAQFEELSVLRSDCRPTVIQEVEMERDALKSEISRMHRDVTGLRAQQYALKCEQKGLCFIKDKADELENVNHKLENCMDVVNKELAKTSHDVIVFNQKMIESGLEARRNAKRFKDLEEHTAALRILIDREKSERIDLDKQLVGLEQQLNKAEQELFCKYHPKPDPLPSTTSKKGAAAPTPPPAAATPPPPGLKKAASKPPTPALTKPDPKSGKPSAAPSTSKSASSSTTSFKPAASNKVAASKKEGGGGGGGAPSTSAPSRKEIATPSRKEIATPSRKEITAAAAAAKPSRKVNAAAAPSKKENAAAATPSKKENAAASTPSNSASKNRKT